jgi:predicted DNA-binding protein YlxM (UPF0122 family)
MSTRKLTEEQVKEIRCLDLMRAHYHGLAECYSLANIAKKFNVAPTTIHNIVYGVSYTDVPFPKCEVTNERCQPN